MPKKGWGNSRGNLKFGRSSVKYTLLNNNIKVRIPEGVRPGEKVSNGVNL
jgi:hypothetical protein